MQDTDIIELRIKHANQLMNEGHLYQAVNELEELCDRHPNEQQSLALLAQIYFLLESHRAVISCINQLIELNSAPKELMAMTAHSHFQIGDFELALQLISQAQKSSPNNPECWKLKGIIELRLGEEVTANQSFVNAQKLSPEHHCIPVHFSQTWLDNQLRASLPMLSEKLPFPLSDLHIVWDGWPPNNDFIGQQLDILLFIPDVPKVIIFHNNLQFFAQTDAEQISLLMAELRHCLIDCY